MEDKAKICNLLLPVLQATRNLSDVKSLYYDQEKETVVVIFASGHIKVANVAINSGTSMIRDIISQIV